MARIGIYGGSFNPVHYGHIGLAQQVVKSGWVDEIWMMVSPNNPLKDSKILTDEQVRLTKLQEAIDEARKQHEDGEMEHVKACDFEFTLPRPSYTANTLRELQKAYPADEFVLVIGEDNWEIFDKWREWEYILANYEVVVYPRHTHSNSQVKATDRPWMRHEAKGVRIIENAPYYDVSSTEIRAKEQMKG